MATGDQPSLLDRLMRRGGSDEKPADDSESKEQGSGDGQLIVDADSLRDRVADPSAADAGAADAADNSDEAAEYAEDPSGYVEDNGYGDSDETDSGNTVLVVDDDTEVVSDLEDTYIDESGVWHVRLDGGYTYADQSGVYHRSDDGTWTVTTPDNVSAEYHRSDDGTWTDENGNEVTNPDTVASLDDVDEQYEDYAAASDDESSDNSIQTGDGAVADGDINNVDGDSGGDIQTGDGVVNEDYDDGSDIDNSINGDGDINIGDDNQQATDDSDNDLPVDSDEPGASGPVLVDHGAALRAAADARFGEGVPQLDPDDARRLADLRGSQLDPDVVQARLGVGPKPPLPEDGSSDLDFGRGAVGPATDSLAADPGAAGDVDAPFEPVALVAPSGLGLESARLDGLESSGVESDGLEIPDGGADPVADSGAADDTADQPEPAEFG